MSNTPQGDHFVVEHAAIFGERLTQIMDERQMSNYLVAKMAGSQPRSIRKYKGGIVPSMRSLWAVSRAVGVNPGWLIGAPGAGKHLLPCRPTEFADEIAPVFWDRLEQVVRLKGNRMTGLPDSAGFRRDNLKRAIQQRSAAGMSLYHACTLAEALDVSLDWLLGMDREDDRR